MAAWCDRCIVAAALAAASPELARLALELCADPLLHAGVSLLERCKSEVTRLALTANNAFLEGDSAGARALAEQALRLSGHAPGRSREMAAGA
jgi:hypothetical protein